MKFTGSPTVEVQVGESVLSFQQDNTSFEVGSSVWPCSLVLVKFAERWASVSGSPYASVLDFGGKRGVELGAGCGVAGMGLFLLGLTRHLVLTDISPVMPALKRNLKRNRALLGSTLKHSLLYWNNPLHIRALRPPFDVVIATDVVYMEETVAPLLAAMDALLADDGVVLLGYQIRSPEAHQLFWELCHTAFHVRKVPHQDLHPDYAYDDADVFILTKRTRDSSLTGVT